MDDMQGKPAELGVDTLRRLVHDVVHEFSRQEQARTEPAHKQELLEEKRRREQLEARLNEVVEENKRSRQRAEELERHSAIRSELQRLGVAKVDLAFKAVKDEVFRTEDGRVLGRSGEGPVELKPYLQHFLAENPELLPARTSGGSGAAPAGRGVAAASQIDLDKIRPGMPAEDLDRARQEISRLALQAMRGQ